MNLTTPILMGAVHAAELPGDTVASLLRTIGDFTGLFADDGPDGGLGMLMSGLSGVAAALAVAIVLTVYFRSRYRSARDIVRHGQASSRNGAARRGPARRGHQALLHPDRPAPPRPHSQRRGVRDASRAERLREDDPAAHHRWPGVAR